ncbi:MAG: MDR family MFS transporter [Myxococcales bacterium]
MRALFPSVRGLPRTYWYLWAGALVNRLGGFVAPFLAIYLNERLGLPMARAGLVVSLYGLGVVGASPLGGHLADRFGRRPVMLASLTHRPQLLLLLGLARAGWALGLAAFAYGMAGDVYRPVNQAIVADVVPPLDRARAFGILYWAVNLGVAVATTLGGVMARRDFWLLFWGDAATTLAFAAIVWRRIPETRPAEAAPAPGGALADLAAPLRDPPFAAFVGLTFLTALVFDQWFAALPLDMTAHGIGTDRFGFVMAENGVLIVLLQPTATALLPRFRRSRVLAAASFLVGLGSALYAFARGALGYALGLAVFTLGEVAQAPIAPSVVADLSPVSQRARYQGIYLMAWGMGVVVAPALGTWVLTRFGSASLWGGCFAASLLCASGHLALASSRGKRLAAVRGEPALTVD